MVILQFNKLIRNKWVWGVFAIAVSAAFCFDDLFTARDRGDDVRAGEAGKLGEEKVDEKAFRPLVDEIRKLERGGDHKPAAEVNRIAWENFAALKVAEKSGIEATDADVQSRIRNEQAFAVNGQFSFERYQGLLRANGMSPEGYEESLRRNLTMERVGRHLLGGAAWVSPMELDQMVADRTDVFTVKVARFNEDRKAADAVKLDDAGLKKWYDEHVKDLELPERVKIRYVKFDATKKEVLAKMTVTENDIRDQFDITADKYTTKDTNGVESVKKFEQLTKAEKDGIEQELRRIAAVQYFETNLNFRAYAKAAAKGASRLDEIAKEDGLKVETSDWFAVNGGYQEGFMTRIGQVLPGAKGAAEAIAQLDPATEDFRYGVVSSDRAVWLVEKTEVSAKHTPKFDEAKNAIRPRALRDAKADAFKASVEAIAKGGARAVLATKNVSTNITFSVMDMAQGAFADQYAVARAAMPLQKDQVSEFTLTMPGHAILVVCVDRVEGDAAKAMMVKDMVRNEIGMLQMRQLPELWRKWNLERLHCIPGEAYSLTETAEVE